MSIGLLDVNMLIALVWPTHVHHVPAYAWFRENKDSGWATCPITETGFIRLSSNRKIIRDAVNPNEALLVLRNLQSKGRHEFWPDDVSILHDCMPTRWLVGHGQTTDAYLLGLAIRNRGRLVTLDRGIASLITDNPKRAKIMEVVSAHHD